MAVPRGVLAGDREAVEALLASNNVRSVFMYGPDRVPSLMIRGGQTYRILRARV